MPARLLPGSESGALYRILSLARPTSAVAGFRTLGSKSRSDFVRSTRRNGCSMHVAQNETNSESSNAEESRRRRPSFRSAPWGCGIPATHRDRRFSALSGNGAGGLSITAERQTTEQFRTRPISWIGGLSRRMNLRHIGPTRCPQRRGSVTIPSNPYAPSLSIEPSPSDPMTSHAGASVAVSQACGNESRTRVPLPCLLLIWKVPSCL